MSNGNRSTTLVGILYPRSLEDLCHSKAQEFWRQSSWVESWFLLWFECVPEKLVSWKFNLQIRMLVALEVGPLGITVIRGRCSYGDGPHDGISALPEEEQAYLLCLAM